MPLFVTFEGGEGSGKSIQAERLYRRLCREGYSSTLTHEPGGTPLGESICHWLKWHKDVEISALTEVLLFNASRRHLVETVIKPALAQGLIVVCDRFYDSTVAYQGYGRGLDVEMVNHLNQLAAIGIVPHLTILLDIPVAEGLSRKKSLRQDRFETESAPFHEAVRRGYLKLASDESQRWFVVDARLSKREIAHIIWNRVSSLLTQSRV